MKTQKYVKTQVLVSVSDVVPRWISLLMFLQNYANVEMKTHVIRDECFDQWIVSMLPFSLSSSAV